eukprot:TRINITY_DN1333_c1_g1_i2.p2 TRINITY_DN1333_c1_g1~~TRINITY_DN1333_c1_g1_i2.p2  ORF type:complete len:200 (+),score=-14.76 TRINITY_DN1333_c1_g1_i2:736-1335(+)
MHQKKCKNQNYLHNRGCKNIQRLNYTIQKIIQKITNNRLHMSQNKSSVYSPSTSTIFSPNFLWHVFRQQYGVTIPYRISLQYQLSKILPLILITSISVPYKFHIKRTQQVKYFNMDQKNTFKKKNPTHIESTFNNFVPQKLLAFQAQQLDTHKQSILVISTAQQKNCSSPQNHHCKSGFLLSTGSGRFTRLKIIIFWQQ